MRANPNFESKNVLLGAFESGTTLIPVKLEIFTQRGVDKGNLYIIVTMTEIENGTSVLDRAVNLPEGEGLTRPDTDSTYSISQIIEKINPKDKYFLKYIPDELLSEEQIKAKESAIENEEKKDASRGTSNNNASSVSNNTPFFVESIAQKKMVSILILEN